MNYLVMECRRAYAVVLCSDGRFLKVANRNYEVGQTLTEVLVFREPRASVLSLNRKTGNVLTAAACVCLMLFGAWQLLLSPFGTVRMTINPDVQFTVNRLERVVKLEGLNEDGMALIQGVSYLGKTTEQLADELADRAVDMGYLRTDGTITVTVSGREGWRVETEGRLRKELDVHFSGAIEIEVTPPRVEEPTEPTTQATVPAATAPLAGESDYGMTDYGQNDGGQSDYGQSSDRDTPYDSGWEDGDTPYDAPDPDSGYDPPETGSPYDPPEADSPYDPPEKDTPYAPGNSPYEKPDGDSGYDGPDSPYN